MNLFQQKTRCDLKRRTKELDKHYMKKNKEIGLIRVKA